MKRYIRSSTDLSDDTIKKLIALYILEDIRDDTMLQTVIRRVLYNENNEINWQEFWQDIVRFMPEDVVNSAYKHATQYADTLR